MRRAPIVITATVLGTAGVLLFKPLPVSSFESSASSGTSGSAAATGSSTGGSGSDASAAPFASAAPTGAATSAPAAATPASATVTGAVETDRYGDTQVKVTIRSGKITAVTVLAYNDDDPRSAQISEQAIPILRQEVLSKQTAAVDTVSGATYTSNAYEASLQSALDKAGFTAADGTKASTDLATADANLRGH